MDRKMFQFKSINTRIMLLCSLLVLIVCIGVASLGYALAARTLRENTDQMLSKTSAQAANIVTSRLEKHWQGLSTLVSNDRFQKPIAGENKDRVLQLMNQFVKANQYTLAFVSDSNGTAYNTIGKLSNIANRDYFQKVMTGENAVSDPTVSKTTGQLAIIYAVPIKNPQGQVIGLCGASRDGNELSDIIADITVGKTGKAFMINSKGVTIAHANRELVLKGDNDFENVKTDSKLQPLVNLEQKMVNGASGTGVYSYHGVTKYMGYAPVAGTNWSLAVTAPEKEIMAGLHSLAFLIFVISLLFIGASLVISYYMARGISLPINQAAKLVMKVSQGDLEQNVKRQNMERQDEIGMLAQAVHNIITSLQEKTAAINDLAKGDLDVKVTPQSEKDILAYAVQEITDSLREKTEAIKELALGDTLAEVKPKSEKDVLAVAVNQIAADLREKSQAAIEIAQGNLNMKIEAKSEKDALSHSMQEMVRNLGQLIEVTQGLTAEAAAGNLEARGEAGKFQGVYSQFIQGINATIDAFAAPLHEAGRILEKMAVNDYTVEMAGTYQGAFAAFANQLNTVRQRFNSVQDAIERVAKGDFSRLEELRKIGKRSENDRIMPSVTQMMGNVLELSNETQRVAEAAVRGDLEYRSQVEQFEGSYRDVAESLNHALNAMAVPLTEATTVLGEMAQGHLDVAMHGDYDGSYGVMKNSINDTLQAFNTLIGEITQAADQVSSGSHQVSEGSTQLAQGATEQASSIEELSASMAEVASQTKQNANNAGQANQLALEAKESAVRGNERMKDMVKAMDEINEASENISKIIKVIDEIAFQTNILALNAAVEAARAGQHGKGFAVVAEEVRNLAARSADAAKETTGYIENSIKKVEGGAKIAKDTAEALLGIVSGSTKVAQLVGEIAVASNQQASGIGQINVGIDQVSKVVQTNSATAQESAAASEELSSLAQLLNENVSTFRLSEVQSSNDAVLSKRQGKTGGRVKPAQKPSSQVKNSLKPGNTDYGNF